MEKVVCPVCHHDTFEVSTQVQDTLIRECNIMPDGSVDLQDVVRDYVGETISISDAVECCGCGRQYSAKELASESPKCEDIWEDK